MTGLAKNRIVVTPRKTRFAQNMTLLALTLTVYVPNRKTFSSNKLCLPKKGLYLRPICIYLVQVLLYLSYIWIDLSNSTT